MPLTPDQRAEIEEQAIETVYADARENCDYLRSIIEGYVEMQDPLEQAHMVTSDEDLWPDFWDFNPRTGEEYPDE